MSYTNEHVASMRRQAWLLEQAQGAAQDDVTTHGHALRMEVMRTTGVYARTSEPADFERMQLAAEHLDTYLAGIERALCAYAMEARNAAA